MDQNPNRREFLEIGLAGLGAIDGRGLAAWTKPDGRLSARPHPPTGAAPPPGASPLGIGSGRDGVLFLPAGYRADHPAALLVLFHGAGGAAARIVNRFRPLAEELDFVILAPDSRDASWDIRYGGFGDDVPFIDRALGKVFDQVAIDPEKVMAGGFSDGASYALSLGLTNGDLFQRLLAFSPGFSRPAKRHGKPWIFISHGTEDEILPIDATSRRIVPELKRAGYQVEYREFEGPHTVVPEIVREAMRGPRDRASQ
jgi:phospholipase/carboxylesterase